MNEKLSGIYARLTGSQGDAYCSYIEDVLAAFADGVTFHVRWANCVPVAHEDLRTSGKCVKL